MCTRSMAAQEGREEKLRFTLAERFNALMTLQLFYVDRYIIAIRIMQDARKSAERNILMTRSSPTFPPSATRLGRGVRRLPLLHVHSSSKKKNRKIINSAFSHWDTFVIRLDSRRLLNCLDGYRITRLLPTEIFVRPPTETGSRPFDMSLSPPSEIITRLDNVIVITFS